MEWPSTDGAGSRFQRLPPTSSPSPEFRALEATLDCGELAQGLWEMLVVKLTFWSPRKWLPHNLDTSMKWSRVEDGSQIPSLGAGRRKLLKVHICSKRDKEYRELQETP